LKPFKKGKTGNQKGKTSNKRNYSKSRYCLHRISLLPMITQELGNKLPDHSKNKRENIQKTSRVTFKKRWSRESNYKVLLKTGRAENRMIKCEKQRIKVSWIYSGDLSKNKGTESYNY